MAERIIVNVLRVPPPRQGNKSADLDKYVFQDGEHAERWMAQPWNPAREGYRVERWFARRTVCGCTTYGRMHTHARLLRRERENEGG